MKAIFYTACAWAVLSPAAQAQERPNPREACKDDVLSFCADVQPGGGRIVNCLEDHYKDISDECYTVLKKISAPPKDHEPPPPRDGDGPGDEDNPPPPPDNGPPPGYIPLHDDPPPVSRP